MPPATTRRSDANDCPQLAGLVDAANGIAVALQNNADANRANAETMKALVERLGPAIDFFEGASTRLDKLCLFIKNNRLKIVAGIGALATGVGAVSPNLANWLNVGVQVAGKMAGVP